MELQVDKQDPQNKYRNGERFFKPQQCNVLCVHPR